MLKQEGSCTPIIPNGVIHYHIGEKRVVVADIWWKEWNLVKRESYWKRLKDKERERTSIEKENEKERKRKLKSDILIKDNCRER